MSSIELLNGFPTLMVDGKPFFALAGEVHNSAAESLETMERDVWPCIEGLNLNTLIVPVYWDRLEPVEGQFDFTLPDGIIAEARDRGVRLILLWFGLWKNAESSYAPGWVKRDPQFFRAEKATGERINAISPLCAAAVEYDAAAFRAFMGHLRAIDGEQNTVILVQVENEVGLLGTPRDYCAAANKAFEAGSWRKRYGDDAEEAFMAHSFATAVEKIAAAGKAAYDLPLYANCWLKQHPWYAGAYPSGGPVADVHTIWRENAPSIAAFAPDIYVPYVADIMEEYGQNGNPLIIPEVRKDAVTASYALAAFMKYNALCYSPFGIEDLGKAEDTTPSAEAIRALSMDPLSFDLTGSREALSAAYKLIDQLKPLYLQHRGTAKMKTFLQRNEQDQGAFLRFSDFDLCVEYLPKLRACPAGSGVVFELSENVFLVAGMMAKFQFQSKPGDTRGIDYLSLERGHLESGEWVTEAILNGDERWATTLLEKPACYRVELYRY